VLESLETPRAISSTARRHGISRSLLMTWRRAFRPEPIGPNVQPTGFVRAMVTAAETMAAEPDAGANDRMVIEIGKAKQRSCGSILGQATAGRRSGCRPRPGRGVRIPIYSGRVFRREAGRHSDQFPAGFLRKSAFLFGSVPRASSPSLKTRGHGCRPREN
jgi:transposase-like protein